MISSTIFRHATSRSVTSTKNAIVTKIIKLSAGSNTFDVVSNRCYVSRAHPPESIPSFPIEHAIEQILTGIEERKVKRGEKWNRNKDKRAEKGIKEDGPYRNQDETVELSLCLNLDPQRPGQALRGSIPLPHGTGKSINVIVFCSDDDEDTTAMAKSFGSNVTVGGLSIVEMIKTGSLPVNFDRTLATPDMMPYLSQIARILGPRGLMPNAKLKTIQPPEKMKDALVAQTSGMVQYRTDKNGNIMAGIGKGSFQKEKLSNNIKAFMNTIQSMKPDNFGKGKKKSGGDGGKKKSNNKNAKYYLKAYLTSTQQKGSVNIDLRTIDPTSSSFMTEVQN